MNEQVLKDLYDRAVSKGYQKSIEEFTALLQDNQDVLADNYSYVQEKGYQKSIEDFSVLVGVKKKDDLVSPSQEVVSESITEQVQEEPSISDTTLPTLETKKVVEGVQMGDVSVEDVPNEQLTAIEREFGKFFITDFFGDMYRAGVQGQAQGQSLDEALTLFSKGEKVSDEEIAEFIAANQKLSEAGVSDEMLSFQEIYDENGGGILGFIKGVAKNPTVVPQLFVSSVSAMANPASFKAALAAGGAGAGVGSVVPVVGTALGAISGAMAGAGGALETGLTFAELIQEQVDGELTNEAIRKVLEDPEAMKEIRFKALGRGLTIAAVEAWTGGLAG